MSNLNAPDLFLPMEALPTETLIWKGKPSPRVVLLSIIRAVIGIFLGAILVCNFVLFTNHMERIERDSKKSGEQAHQANPPSSSQEDPSSGITASKRDTREMAPGNIVLWMFLSAAGFVAGIFFIPYGLASFFYIFRARSADYLITTERICIQTGLINKQLVIIDFDKVISFQATASWMERLFGLHSIGIIHAGSGGIQRPTAFWMTLGISPNVMTGLPVEAGVFSKMNNEWLPRDNRK